ncbi:craniofacial development protein 2-like [Plakobranchus ocellatus]|uniref:Craniofacial development protein 2-like n=1 Tax=Plakobranchus ocellatus TaxID=259542 RepID=A0AAV4DVP3_9GAST|nr:craniofacial development protein 2-like [Plakobranchus ocellatus]
MGDFNAVVGDERVEDGVGPSGIGTANERGIRLIEWCQINDFTITNTWYQNHPGDSGLGRAPEIEVETKQITSSFRKYSETLSKHRSHCLEPTVIQIIFQSCVNFR